MKSLCAVVLGLAAMFCSSQAGISSSRGIVGDFFGDIFQKYKNQVAVAKTIFQGLQRGDAPHIVVKDAIQKHPHAIKNFSIFTAFCDLPTAKIIPGVGPACQFIDSHMDLLIAKLDGSKPQNGALIDKLGAAMATTHESVAAAQ